MTQKHFFSPTKNLATQMQGINHAVPGEVICLKQSGSLGSPVRSGYHTSNTAVCACSRRIFPVALGEKGLHQMAIM